MGGGKEKKKKKQQILAGKKNCHEIFLHVKLHGEGSRQLELLEGGKCCLLD